MRQEPERKYTLEEYWKLVETFPDRKYEYADGYIRMMTGGSVPHGEIAMNIGAALHAALRHSACHVYNSDVAVELFGQKCYYPDISVSCDPDDWARKKALESPTVVVEVLSPSTEGTDRIEKLKAYKRYPTIQEILLVDARKCYVEHYHRLNAYKWEESAYESMDDVIDLTSIQVQLIVQDIYLKVSLELDGSE